MRTSTAVLAFAVLIAAQARASVLPPIEVTVELSPGVRSGTTYDVAGRVAVRLPAVPPNDDVERIEVALVPEGDLVIVGPHELVFDRPPLDRSIGQRIHVRVPGAGQGALTAVATSYDAGGTRLWSKADTAFVLAAQDDFRVGHASLPDLVRERLDARATVRGWTAGSAAARDALLRGEMPVPGTLDFAAPASARNLAPAAVATTTVSGTTRYVVKGGTTAAGPHRAIAGATVRFVDRAPGGDVAIGSPTTTGSDGSYAAVVPGQRGDASAVNLVVQVLALSTAAKVGPTGQRANVYVKESAPVTVAAATTTIHVVAGPESLTVNKAFSIVDATTVAFDFLRSFNSQTGVGADPISKPLVFIEFPGTNANGSFFSQSGDAHLNIGLNHGFDWDVLHHEYGHYVQFLNGTSVGVGGHHYITGNNTGNNGGGRPAALTKTEGTKLAWGEGWPTFFGTNLQIAMNAASFSVPTAGDTRYDDTGNAFGYDLESNTDMARGTGEDNELAVQRVLWDLADSPMDESDEITFGPAAMWQHTIGGTKPITISAFWNVILPMVPPSTGSYSTGGLVENQLRYGAIYGDHGIAPLALEPIDNAAIAATPPTFKWRTQGAGGSPNPIAGYGPSYRLNKFKVKFYDEKLQTLVFTSPEVTKNGTTDTMAEYTPSAAAWTTIRNTGPIVKWTVEGSSTSPAPTTGAYLTKARTLGGANIAFVIDDTGSMGEEIGGVRAALTAFVQGLASITPPQNPFIEVITFKDDVTRRIVSSDLTAIQGVVDSLFADGGDDCPESSAEALLTVAGDVIGSFANPTGKKGQILFATDASPHAGYNLGGIKQSIQAKGIDIIEILTADCVGTLNPLPAPASLPAAEAAGTCAASTNAAGNACEPIVADVSCAPCRVGTDGGPADESVFYTSGQGPTPSSVVAFSDIAAATGGLISFHPEVNFGSSKPFEAAITNAALGAVVPRVIDLTPQQVPADAEANVAITARNTNFGPESTITFSGTGITVNGVEVVSPTLIVANVSAAPDAPFGFRNVTVSTPLGDEIEHAIGTSVVEVTPPSPFALVTSVQPTLVARGTTVDVRVTAASSSFAAGTSTPDFGPGVTVDSLSVLRPTALTARVTIAEDADLGLRNVTVTTGAELATENVPGPLNVASTLADLTGSQITSITPASGMVGQTLDVALTGANTSFSPDSIVSFSGTGVDVVSVTARDESHLTMRITIAADAALGFRDVSVTTGPEVASLRTGFEIRPTPPEMCGNCADDDGDGAVDFEDDDCCAMPATLELARLAFKIPKKSKPKPLKLVLRVPSGFDDADPTAAETTIQLRNGNGELVCATLGTDVWKQKRRKFTFKAAGGTLAKGSFTMNRRGVAKLAAAGKLDLASFDDPVFTATLRIGGRCAEGQRER